MELKNKIKKFLQIVEQEGLVQALKMTIRYFIIYFGLYYPFFLLKSPKQLSKRITILKQFKKIHRIVQCAHHQCDLLFIADYLLKIPSSLEGDIIECGVFKGGSTCKLSILAKLTGRKLIACDSFQGLPQPEKFDAIHRQRYGQEEVYKKGDWSGGLTEVRSNINSFGESKSVTLIPGWFHQSLPKLKHQKFVAIFLDVDLYNSIKCCLLNLWPNLQPGCKLFTHEAYHDLTRELFSDQEFWMKNFGDHPPQFIGGQTGLHFFTYILGYVTKS